MNSRHHVMGMSYIMSSLSLSYQIDNIFITAVPSIVYIFLKLAGDLTWDLDNYFLKTNRLKIYNHMKVTLMKNLALFVQKYSQTVIHQHQHSKN